MWRNREGKEVFSFNFIGDTPDFGKMFKKCSECHSLCQGRKFPGLFEHLLPGFNLHNEIILIRGVDTDVLLVIDT